jgi:hypothetical protein
MNTIRDTQSLVTALRLCEWIAELKLTYISSPWPESNSIRAYLPQMYRIRMKTHTPLLPYPDLNTYFLLE